MATKQQIAETLERAADLMQARGRGRNGLIDIDGRICPLGAIQIASGLIAEDHNCHILAGCTHEPITGFLFAECKKDCRVNRSDTGITCMHLNDPEVADWFGQWLYYHRHELGAGGAKAAEEEGDSADRVFHVNDAIEWEMVASNSGYVSVASYPDRPVIADADMIDLLRLASKDAYGASPRSA